MEALRAATASLEYAIATGSSTSEALWAAFYAIRAIVAAIETLSDEEREAIYDEARALASITGSIHTPQGRYVHGAALSLIDRMFF